jgi:hypothetical protein
MSLMSSGDRSAQASCCDISPADQQRSMGMEICVRAFESIHEKKERLAA